jgi:methionyl-tRNA formyltransferase
LIYLFCNERYGRAFLAVAAEECRKEGVPIRAVFSGRHDPPSCSLRGPFRRTRNILARRIRERRLGKEHGVPAEIVRDVNAPSFRVRIRKGDHGIIAGFNQIFRPETIRGFRSFVNFHPSLLPYYRGPVPSYWCLKNGEETTGFTLHTVTARVDDGEFLHQEEVAVGGERDPGILDGMIAAKGSACLRKYLEHLRTGRPWEKKVVDAARVYKVHVDYASFPREDETEPSSHGGNR